MHVEHRELVRDAEIGVGRVRGLLLVPERHVFDAELVAGIDQRVVGVAALAEHLGHAFLLRQWAMNMGIAIDDLAVFVEAAARYRGGDRRIQFEPVLDTRFVGRKAFVRQQVARP